MKAFRITWTGGPSFAETRAIGQAMARRLDGILSDTPEDISPDYVACEMPGREDEPLSHQAPAWSLL